MKEGKYREAADLLREPAARPGTDPEQRRVMRLHLEALVGSGLIIQAGDGCEKYLRRFPDDARAREMRARLAQVYEAQGRYAEAVAVYAQMAQRETDAARAAGLQHDLARYYDRILLQPRNAEREYGKFLEKFAQDKRANEAALRLAQIRDRLNKQREAAADYRAWVEKNPKDERAPGMLLRAVYLLGPRGSVRDYAGQAAALERYISLFPKAKDLPQRWAELGYCYRHRLRQYQKAVAAYEKSLALKQAHDAMWNWMETVRSTAKEREPRIAALRKFLAAFPQSGNVRRAEQYLCDQLRDAGKHAEQAAVLQGMVKKYPKDCSWELGELGYAHRRLKNPAEAFKMFLEQASRFPDYNTANTCYYMILAAMEAKQPQMAEAPVLKREAEKPQDLLTWYIAYELYYQRLKDYKKAAAKFNELLAKYPDSSYSNQDNGINRLVDCHRRLKNLDGAIADLRKFHAANPGAAWNPRYAKAMAASLLFEQKKYKEALAEAAAVVDPAIDDLGHVLALLVTARCQRELEQRDAMIKTYAAVSHARWEHNLRWQHGAIDRDRKSTLKPLLEDKAFLGELKGEALLLRGMLHHGLGDMAAAIKDYDAYIKAARLRPRSKHAALALRREAQALADFKARYAKGPWDDLPAQSIVRRAQEAHGRRDAATAVRLFNMLKSRSPKRARWADIRIASAWDYARVWSKAGPAYLALCRKYPDAEERFARRAAAIWLDYWKDQRSLKTVRGLIVKVANKHGGESNIYYAYRILAEPKPREIKKALARVDAYEEIQRRQKDVEGLRRATDWRRACYRSMAKYEDAGKAVEAWARANPDNPYAPNYCYAAMEDYVNARKYDKVVPVAQFMLDKGLSGDYLFHASNYVGSNARKYDLAVRMIDVFMEKHPTNYRSRYEARWRRADMLWRTGKHRDEVVALWRKWFDEWQGGSYRNSAAGSLLSYYQNTAKDPKAALALCREMVDRLDPNRSETHYAAFLLAQHYRATETRDDARFLAAAQLIMEHPAGQGYHLACADLLADYYREKGRHLDAAVALARGIRFGRKDGGRFNTALNIAAKLSKLERYEECVALARHLMKANKSRNKDQYRAAENVLTLALIRSGGGVETIDDSLPQAGLLRGDILARRGEEELAFQRYLQNQGIFEKYHRQLSADYHLLIAQRLLGRGRFDDAVNVARSFLIAHKDNKKISAEDRARVQLFLGDCYREDGREEIARDEYRTCANLYKDTPQATDARFRIGESFLTQKMFGSAEELFAELAQSESRDVVIRATLMRGILFNAMEKEKESMEEFRKALSMNPPDQVADEVFFRLGNLYRGKGKLKEAYNLYRLVGSGGREAKRKVEPGTRLRFRLSDRDLTITRGQASVPILVESSSGDRELVKLQPSEAGGGIFVGDIRTVLGRPVKDDRTLQVKGGDTVVYRYDPGFARDFVLKAEAGKAGEVAVAADADLKVSATQIAEEEGEEAQVKKALEAFAAYDEARLRHRFRNEKQVKPGNNIYLRVADADMSRTDQKDTLAVLVTADSGDSVSFELEETGPHTGIFRGTLPTALRPPDAVASDASPENAPLRALDGNPAAASCWMARRDGRVPKWFMVDMKELHPLTRVVWHRGQGAADRGILRYVLFVSEDREDWRPLAIVHSDRLVLPTVEVLWDPDGYQRGYGARNMLLADGNTGSHWMGHHGRREYLVDLDLGGRVPVEKTILRPHGSGENVRRYELYVPAEPGAYPGKKRELDGWKRIYVSERWDRPRADTVDWKGREARYLRLRVTEYFHGRARIGEFEVYPKLTSKVTPAAEGIGAEVGCEAVKCRYVRMQILEYDSDAPAIATFAVYAGEDRVAPKPDINVLDLATNQTLEITPGDAIKASYLDDVNVNPGRPRTLRDSVQATFFDGAIGAVKHYWIEDERGNRTMHDEAVCRIEPGKRFIVRVTDYDADSTEGVDTVPITVRSSTGQEQSLTATETRPYSGVFTKEVDTAAPAPPPAEGVVGGAAVGPRPGELVLKPGDTVTVTFADKENTIPGHATDRNLLLQVNAPAAGSIRILDRRELIPGREVPAEAPARPPGAPALVALDEALTLEVIDPDRALDGGSTVRVDLSTSSGAAAEVECRIESEDDLKAGRFVGRIPLRLGDKDSPDRIMDVTELPPSMQRRSSYRRRRLDEGFPVLNVNGSDTITATFVDAVSPEEPPDTRRTAAARLVTDATIGVFDDRYENPVTDLHVGDYLYLKVVDPDASLSAEKDSVTVILASSTGDRRTVQLVETLGHSGEFTRSVLIEPAKQPDPNNDKFEADYDSTVKVAYVDIHHTASAESVTREVEARVVIGSDGAVLAFGKKYAGPAVAVETQYKIGKSLFELGRKHAELGEKEKDPNVKETLSQLARKELAQGREILAGLLHNYPDSERVPEVAYLLAQLAQAEKRYDEAIEAYERITRDYPDRPTAADAQYRIGICCEKQEEFDSACDAYVQLAYKYPDATLVGDAMIRIGLHFFRAKKFDKAVHVFGRYIELHPDHPGIEGVWFKKGLALILGKKYHEAAAHLEKFIEQFPEAETKPAALYWAGDAYLNANDAEKAYQMFKRVVWDFPDAKWAKWARGRLTAPVFERIE